MVLEWSLKALAPVISHLRLYATDLVLSRTRPERKAAVESQRGGLLDQVEQNVGDAEKEVEYHQDQSGEHQ